MHPLERLLEYFPQTNAIDELMKRVPFFRKAWISGLGKLFRLLPFSPGISVVNEDWDYLIVLDACRYDLFRKHNFLEGHLEKRISKGPITSKWIKENFNGNCEDIVYVSANPLISGRIKDFVGSNPFHRVENLWDYGWDESLGATPPDAVNETALEMMKKFPDKRMIIHYVQPHHPFIADPRADELRERFGAYYNTWQLVGKGILDREWAVSAYEKNLKLVLEKVQELINELSGRIVVTGDHGDSFGEYWIYGHPSEELYLSQLIEVPWLVIEKGSRKMVSSEKGRINNKIERLKSESKI